MRRLLWKLLTVALAYGVTATNYCSPSLCSENQKHIACGNNGRFDVDCPRDAALIDMTNNLRQLLEDAHNEKRNYVASGADRRFSAACRMATMQWDDELAQLAELNVLKCTMKHDRCHNTDSFQRSGQNLAWFGYFEPVDNAEQLKDAVEMWFKENTNANMNVIHKYPNNAQGPPIGHFTVMMADHNTRLGCAAATYSIPNNTYKAYLIACNYATTNVIGYPIYAACTAAASQCTTGTDPAYGSLCSKREPINPNDLSK